MPCPAVPAVRFTGVSRFFGDVRAIDGVTFAVDDGEFFALLGPSGSGKTSPKSQVVDVRFRLPGVPKEIRARGEIIRLSEGGKGIGFHVRFTELDVESELAVARYIDDLLVSPPEKNKLVP